MRQNVHKIFHPGPPIAGFIVDATGSREVFVNVSSLSQAQSFSQLIETMILIPGGFLHLNNSSCNFCGHLLHSLVGFCLHYNCHHHHNCLPQHHHHHTCYQNHQLHQYNDYSHLICFTFTTSGLHRKSWEAVDRKEELK